MSLRFDNPRTDDDGVTAIARLWGRVCVLIGVSMLLHACSASGPSRPDTESSESAGAPEVAEMEEAPRPSRAERRRARRAAEAAQEEGEVEAVPEEATRAYDRALAAMLSGDDTEAELELEQLILEFPDYPGPHVNLAILYQRDARMEEALDALERALDIDPGHAAANNQLGILHRSEGRFEEAEVAYRRAIETDPEYALAHYNLGVLLDLYLKRPAEALEHYEAYQALRPEPDETVSRWIVDLRRRLGMNASTARVAPEDGS